MDAENQTLANARSVSHRSIYPLPTLPHLPQPPGAVLGGLRAHLVLRARRYRRAAAAALAHANGSGRADDDPVTGAAGVDGGGGVVGPPLEASWTFNHTNTLKWGSNKAGTRRQVCDRGSSTL